MRLAPPALLLLGLGSVIAACGARTDLDQDRSANVDEEGPALRCPAITTCGAPTADACAACVRENLGPCAELDTCDATAAPATCDGVLPENLRCRLDAVEAVECMLTCPFQTCEDVYFGAGRGPTMPVGLAFNDFVCAVCHPCASVCAATPNFSVVCDALG